MKDDLENMLQQQAGSAVGNVELVHPLGALALALFCAMALLLPRRARD